VIRRITLVAIVLGLVALAIWLPREEQVAADAPVAEVPIGVDLRAERGTPAPPFIERWELSYPWTPPASQTLTLAIGDVTGTTAPGRLTAAPGQPQPLLDRIAEVLVAKPADHSAPRPVPALDVRLDLLGDHLSVDPGEIGQTVIAGAFVAEPAGTWRVYRLTIGADADGPQLFLGLSADARAAVLLPRELTDGPAIHARLRSLLVRGPAAS
jgi:hypothetical protein